MRQFATLTSLFLKQLLRRKSLWIVVALFGVMMLVNYLVHKQLQEALDQGVRYDIATRRASSALTSFAEQLRYLSLALVLLVSALVAPAARKDGTAQFVLCLSVSRYRLAATQFAALSVFVVSSLLVVHAGFVVAARGLGAMTVREMAVGWVMLVGPLWLASAVVFSLSLSRPAVVVYGILLAVPYLVLPLGEAALGEWPRLASAVLLRFVDNLELLFPNTQNLILWPRLNLAVGSTEPPFPRWGWDLAQHALASAFWIAVGLWRYRHHDLGSRVPTR